MHWVLASGALIAAVASWRFVVRPLRRAWAEGMGLLRQIRDASGGVQQLSRELHTLAGAFVQFAMHNSEEIRQVGRQLEELAKRHADLADLYLDVAADVARIDRTRKGA